MHLQIASTKKKIFRAKLSLKDSYEHHHECLAKNHSDVPDGIDHETYNAHLKEEGDMTRNKIIATETFIERRSNYLEDAKSKCWEESLLPSYRYNTCHIIPYHFISPYTRSCHSKSSHLIQ